MGRPAEQHEPLYTAMEEEQQQQQQQSTDKKKKRRVRMDPQTQSSLTLIHKALAEDDRVKSGFMKTTSQLVNDRQVKKDRAVQKRCVMEDKRELGHLNAASSAESIAGDVSVSQSVVSRNNHSTENTKDSSLNDSARSDKKSAWINSYKKKKSLYLNAYASSKDKSPNVSPTSSDASSLKPASHSSFQSSTSSNSSSRSFQRRSSSTLVKSKMPSWLEALKKKQKSLRAKQTSSRDVKVEDDEPMVFQLSPRKRPKFTPPSSPEAAAVVPWANVKLRSTPKRGDLSVDPVTGKVGMVDKPEGNVDVGAIRSNEEETLPNLFSAGDVVDLDSLPKSAFASSEETEIFPLLASKWTQEQEPRRVVIVGKDVIVTANRLSGRDKKASILWWSHRCDIRSLTLNVDATGANLALTNGRPSMPLAFPSADVCLNFAQYFLRGPSKSDEQKDDSDVEVSPSTDANVSVLTAEEESLLDKYRQFSQSDRLKLKLTCLSPRGEPEELEVNLSPRIANQSVVNASVPEKYSKMLKMGIPSDAVRHKMTMDGVDDAIVKLVVDSIDAPSANIVEKCSGLSDEEEAVATKYRKMLKMGVPPEGVRHKMATEGVDAKIVDAVLNDSSSKEDPKGLSDEDETVASKYRKMLKMGVPPEGVRHKMTTEGVDAKIIDAVLALPESEGADGPNRLSEKEDAIASKYRKMLKMRIPLDAVKHKMTMEAVDSKIVSVIVSEAGGDAAVPPTPLVPKKKAESEAPVLTAEEEKKASKYRMMIKVCIPKDAIRHDMKKEGVSERIVEAVLGKEWLDVKEVSNKTPKPKENNRKTIQFHWTTSNLPPELLQQSIFGKVDQKKRKISTINPEESDISRLEELFQKRDNSAAAKKKAAAADGAGEGMAKLLDLTRANNIAISLKAFNDFTFRDLAETMNDLDPDRKIVGERVQFISNLLPNPKEIAAIKKFKGDDDKLITGMSCALPFCHARVMC